MRACIDHARRRYLAGANRFKLSEGAKGATPVLHLHGKDDPMVNTDVHTMFAHRESSSVGVCHVCFINVCVCVSPGTH